MFKTIDRLVLSSFWGPYLASFFVAEFVLLMQLLWKFVDDILGKGITFIEIMTLLSYFAITIIPLSIPLTILISSVMVFGNMAEKYELASMKSAGVSLIRIMRAGIFLAVMTAILSIASSSYLVPKANYEFHRRLIAIRKQKPSLTIEEGVFNKDFRGFVIRVGKKDKDGKGIRDVMVYDHTANDKSLINETFAEKGEMFVEQDGNVFIMNLKNGTQYHEMKKEKSSVKDDKYPFMRTEFEEWNKIFDMTEFGLDLSGDDMGRNRQDMMGSIQLYEGIDSINGLINLEYDALKFKFDGFYSGAKISSSNRDDIEKKERKTRYQKFGNIDTSTLSTNTISDSTIVSDSTISQPENSKIGGFNKTLNKFKKAVKNTPNKYKNKQIQQKMKKPGLLQKDTSDLSIYSSFMETLDSTQLMSVFSSAVSSSLHMRDRIKSSQSTRNILLKQQKNYTFKLNQHFAIALVCILFLFIGAPLGSIVRKGGYGFPLLAAIVFYMIFMMSTIMSQKLIRSPNFDPVLLAWLPCLILLPLSILLTWMALKDRKLKIPSFKFLKRKSSE